MLTQIDLNIIINTFNLLNISINIEKSISQNTIMINDGYDLILDEKREIFDNIEAYMMSAAHEVLIYLLIYLVSLSFFFV